LPSGAVFSLPIRDGNQIIVLFKKLDGIRF